MQGADTSSGRIFLLLPLNYSPFSSRLQISLIEDGALI